MTLCIAAVCRHESEDKIITVSDYRLTDGEGFCHESCCPKFRTSPLKRWLTLYTGETRIAEEVWGSTRGALIGRDETMDTVWKIHQAKFAAALERFEAELKDKKDNYQCPQHCGLAETKLLIAGFDRKDMPRILIMDKHHTRDGDPPQQVTEGFSAVGNGDNIAKVFLEKFYPFSKDDPIEATIFKLCAAKVALEPHRAIGKETSVTVHNAKGGWWGLRPAAIDQIRLLCQRVPTEVESLIASSLADATIGDDGEILFGKDYKPS